MNNIATILAGDLANKHRYHIMFMSVEEISGVLQSNEEMKDHKNEVNFVN